MIADTNVLVLSAVRDSPQQAAIADSVLRGAATIAISVQSLCEFVWVLRYTYRFQSTAIALAIRTLMDIRAAALDRPAIEAGLHMLDAGGDFADGVIAYEGEQLGGDLVVSFDKRAVKLLQAQGKPAQLLA